MAKAQAAATAKTKTHDEQAGIAQAARAYVDAQLATMRRTLNKEEYENLVQRVVEATR
jgi:hypothetical protein